MVKKSKGFSLLEVLISLIFLSIGLLAMAGLQATSIKGNFFSNNLTQATYVAQDTLEFLKNIPLDSAALQTGSHNQPPLTIAGVAFNRSYTVIANGNLRVVRYNVAWNDGTVHNIIFSTIRSQ